MKYVKYKEKNKKNILYCVSENGDFTGEFEKKLGFS